MKRAVSLILATAALAVPAVALGFDNTEPFAGSQWYLTEDEAWSYWPSEPELFPVRVAVIDSGIDGSHPDLRGRVVAAKSFVGGSPYRDYEGHGTFVAGEIAASPFNGVGIAGLAFNARLVIAKVVDDEGTVPLDAEVAAIRWAVDQGAQVINLSLGGVRDPLDAKVDTYSSLEQAAIDYAYSKGVVVVAAVGNGTQSPKTPWPYAHYPAALPHVIGVSAVRRDGSVPQYSNRDAIFNDITAPGDRIFSTIPAKLEVRRPGCVDHPYSDCGTLEFRDAIGTSFAAPQVSAAAALLLGQDPKLKPEQVAWLLERSADDVNSTTGCVDCAAGRDAFTGWGRLDVLSALTMLGESVDLPPADRYEPNDDAGPWAHALPPLPRTVDATLDYWDDNLDVYRVRITKGARLFVHVDPAANAGIRLALWAPGTTTVEGLRVDTTARLAVGHRVGRQSRLAYSARVGGVYYLAVKLITRPREPLQYTLALSRRSP